MKYIMIPTEKEATVYDEDKKCYIEAQLFRIRATKDFSDVKIGDLGGFVQNESNLSHKGNCWIYDEAKVYDGAVIKGNAQIRNNAIVRDKSKVDGEAQVLDSAIIEGCSNVTDNAKVYNRVKVTGCSIVKNNAKVYGEAEINGASIIEENGQVSGLEVENSVIRGEAFVKGKGTIAGSVIKDNSVIQNSKILNSNICGDTIILESFCKMLNTTGGAFIKESNIGTLKNCTIDVILENAKIIKSNIEDSKIKNSNIHRSVICCSADVIDSSVNHSNINGAFIKSGSIRKDTDYINYNHFGSNDLDMTFYRGKNQTIYASVNKETVPVKGLLDHIKEKFSERVLTEVTQLLDIIKIEGMYSIGEPTVATCIALGDFNPSSKRV